MMKIPRQGVEDGLSTRGRDFSTLRGADLENHIVSGDGPDRAPRLPKRPPFRSNKAVKHSEDVWPRRTEARSHGGHEQRMAQRIEEFLKIHETDPCGHPGSTAQE